MANGNPNIGRVSIRLGWNLGAVNATPPPPPPVGLPRGIMTGITARSYPQGSLSSNARALIDSMVIDFHVADAMPTRGVLDPAWVKTMHQQLDWASANRGTSGSSIPVSLRPRFGIWASPYFHTLAGHMDWYTTHGTDADPNQPDPLSPTFFKIPQGTPRWWGATYLTLVEEFYTALAAEFGTHPAVVEVDMGIASTQFMEPCVHQLGSLTNVNTLAASGWTEAAEDATFVGGWQIFMRTWAPYRVGCFTTFNDIGTFDPSIPKFRAGLGRVITLIEKNMAVTAGLTVLANESLSNNGGDTGTMYNRLRTARAATPPTIIRYQSETYGNLSSKYGKGTSTQGTLDSAIAMGATTLEIPVGCENPSPAQPLMYISPAAAASYNNRFLANTVGLYAP